jgi:hypothetical protein
MVTTSIRGHLLAAKHVEPRHSSVRTYIQVLYSRSRLLCWLLLMTLHASGPRSNMLSLGAILLVHHRFLCRHSVFHHPVDIRCLEKCE